MKIQFTTSGVRERDIDILLQEEFVPSADFSHWFAEEINLQDHEIPILNVNRSVTTSVGESDLEVMFNGKSGKTKVLIENKISASFQPEQAKRYKIRGRESIISGECDDYLTVLIAPEQYLLSLRNKEFDEYLSYEKLLEYFSQKTAASKRHSFKTYLIKKAIEKSVKGYQPKEDKNVSDFWLSYWESSLLIAPELEMSKPEIKPAGAGFVYFNPLELPSNISLVHKLTHGNVDLQFRNLGKKLNKIRKQYESRLAPGMTIERANKSAAIRVHVPKLFPGMSFNMQKAKVEEALDAAKKLLEWFNKLYADPDKPETK